MSYNTDICPVCKNQVGGADVSNGYCSTCNAEYSWFKRRSLPDNWKSLTRGYYPSYDEWWEEQLIKSQLKDGIITPEEASKRAAALAEKVARHYGVIPSSPTSSSSARPTSVFDMPSILPPWPPKF